MTADNLSTTGTVQLDYQINGDVGSSSWYGYKELKSAADEFSLDDGKVTQYRLRLRFYTTSATAPAVLTGIEAFGTIFNPLKYRWIATYRVGHNQSTLNSLPDHDPDAIVNFLQSAHEKGKALKLRSRIKEMDDRFVNISAPAIEYENRWVENGKPYWSGRVSIAISDT